MVEQYVGTQNKSMKFSRATCPISLALGCPKDDTLKSPMITSYPGENFNNYIR